MENADAALRIKFAPLRRVTPAIAARRYISHRPCYGRADGHRTLSPTESTLPRLPAPPVPDADARWALFLDVDGTLLEFNDDPRAVNVSEPLLALLHALHDALDGALALVSGRELDDLDRLFGQPRWAGAGLHGLQLRRADGSFRRLLVTPEEEHRMHQATTALVARFDGVQLEDKQLAVALHCRRAPHQFDELRAAAEALIARLPGYELQPGNLVVEFKPAGMDKGRAVNELLASAPFNGRVPVYLGDDLTDEHAFASLSRKQGIGVLVGSPRATQASFSLPDPASVAAWLLRVLDALKQGPSPHDEPSAERPARQP
jgi:trehalose 6-phosphate phosphatase